MKDSISKEKFYPHGIEDVWNAITTAAQISVWFLKADFKAEPGYDYTLTHEVVKPDGECSSTVVKGKVLKADPVHHLSYTWIVDGATETTVDWYLEEKDGGTLLKLEHSGISNYPSEQIALNMFNSFSGGWDNCLSELEKYMKTNVHA
jgi:uncharacterized protein YndB with AHSA1/START domain